MSPAEIERRIRGDGNLAVLEETHHHRAWHEDAMRRVRGRDRLRDLRLDELIADGVAPLTIDVDGADMIAYTTGSGWRGHRWICREGERIIGETAIIDGVARAAALGLDIEDTAHALGRTVPMHAPLGELRPGRGQLDTADMPVVEDDAGTAVRAAARYLHQLWNARALDQAAPRWRGPSEAGSDGRAFVLTILAALSDAVCLIERTTMLPDGRVGLLWRLHGHHLGSSHGGPSGKRARLIGSSIVTIDGDQAIAEDMLIDTLALRATPYRPIIDYSN